MVMFFFRLTKAYVLFRHILTEELCVKVFVMFGLQKKDNRLGELSIPTMRQQIGCWSIIGGALLLGGLCYFVMFYSPKDGTPGRVGLNFVDRIGKESIECIHEVRGKNATELLDVDFAKKCYTNPFFLWSGLVFFSIILSACCII